MSNDLKPETQVADAGVSSEEKPKSRAWRQFEARIARRDVIVRQQEEIKALREQLNTTPTGRKKRSLASRARQGRAMREAWRRRKANAMDPEPHEPAQPALPAPVRDPTGRKKYLRSRELPPELKEQLASLAAEIRAEIVVDMGGEENIPAIKKRLIDNFLVMEVIKQLMLHDIQRFGTHTIKGRVRSSVDGLFKAADRQTNIGKLLGLARQAKKADESIADWIAAQAREGASAGDDESSAGNAGETLDAPDDDQST